MILKSVQVTNFKCIKDSSRFTLDENVTCLVGKNESGKTAVLQALEKLRPLVGKPGDFNELEFPRAHLSEFKEQNEEKRFDAISARWLLDDGDTTAVAAKVGEGVLESREVEVTYGYYEQSYWTLTVNESKALANLLDRHELHTEERKALESLGSVAAVYAALSKKAAKANDKGQEVRSPREQLVFVNLEADYHSKGTWQTVADILGTRIPHFVYFSDYHRMPGQVSLADLKSRIAGKNLEKGHEVFLALLSLIGRDVDELEDIDTFEQLQAELEAASNRLTKEIFRYWSQNRNLRVQFRFDQARTGDPAPFNTGFVLRTRIENTRHGVTTSFDDRSAGFVWFFSFLVWFSQARKTYGDNLVILLDEPGLTLHATAQSDLLRYIEERLAPKYQVIYTTHSPFLLDPSNLLRARTVEDVYEPADDDDPLGADNDLGTKVGDQILSTDKETLFPLRACLGYEITQSLFVGENCLLVEGPSDLLYLTTFSQRLRSLKRQGLDKRWTITPCGGIDKLPSFVSLFSGQRLNMVALVDYASGEKGKVRRIEESRLLAADRLLLASTFAEQPEADVEDILGREAYVDLVNKCYELQGKLAVPKNRPASAPNRCVKEVEDHFASLPPKYDAFDHFKPAEFLTRAGGQLGLSGESIALDRFERLFAEINSLLPA